MLQVKLVLLVRQTFVFRFFVHYWANILKKIASVCVKEKALKNNRGNLKVYPLAGKILLHFYYFY